MMGLQLVAYWARDDSRRDDELSRFARLEFGEDAIHWAIPRGRSARAGRRSLRGLFRGRKSTSPSPAIPVGGAIVPTDASCPHPPRSLTIHEP